MKALITVFLAAVVLTGCTAVPAAAPEPAPHSAVKTPAPVVKKTTLGFGETYNYDSGVTLTVSAPEEFTPGPYAAGTDQAHNLVFTLTIVNGTKKNLDPSPFTSVSSASTEASQIFDTTNGLDSAPSTVILPGGTITWKEAFSVADPVSLILQTSPNFDYINIVFTNTK